MRVKHMPGPLTLHLARHGWRITRFRDGMNDFRLGETVASSGVTPATVGKVVHLEVSRTTVPASSFPHQLELQAVLVAAQSRLVALPPWYWRHAPGQSVRSPAPALRIVSGDSA